MLYPDESYRIMGACFEVHNRLGSGFLEAVCLAIELRQAGTPFVEQADLRITYRDEVINQQYRADFICFDKMLLEIKAVDRLMDRHESQVLNYLHATRIELGVLVNFGAQPNLESKRTALTRQSRPG